MFFNNMNFMILIFTGSDKKKMPTNSNQTQIETKQLVKETFVSKPFLTKIFEYSI